jgi:hypothetical protein
LSRAKFMPSLMRLAMSFWDSTAGPRVQTILVCRMSSI